MTITHQEFGGERPLFASHDLQLDHVTIHAGESALKESTDITATDCRFEGKYPFWHNQRFTINRCHFTEGARAALWYSSRLTMTDTTVDAPKMFRDMEQLSLTRVRLTNAAETLWFCRGITLNDVTADHADYIMMHCDGIDITDFHLQGNYAFQYSRNITIRNSVLETKDAFWNTENVTVIDSVIHGEYLGWHSRNLRLVRCHIAGTQPLCYAHGLLMEDCTMDPDADLAFEYSSLHADIIGPVTSVKNPRTGHITADSIGEIILDENIRQPADCEIITK